MDANELASACSVQIKARARQQGAGASGTIDTYLGSGFFVGRDGLLLTCSHVMRARGSADVIAVWAGKEWPCEVLQILPDPFPDQGKLADGMPDLALLRCQATNRDALILDPTPGLPKEAPVLLYGFSEEADQELLAHPVESTLEGRIDLPPGAYLLQFDTGRVLKGMSGGAILSRQNGRVVAVTKRRFQGDFTACYGVPAEIVLRQMPVLETAQRTLLTEIAASQSAQRMIELPAANAFFFNRRAELAALTQSLRQRRVSAVLGPDGIGKSALAREYVLNTLGDYVEVLWVDAADAVAARRSLTAVAKRLGQQLPAEPAAAAQSLYQAIEQSIDTKSQPWLVVLDGLEEVELGRALLPQSSAARTLITSHRAELRGLGAVEPVSLAPLSAEQTRDLVAARLGAAAEGAPLEAIVAQSGGVPGLAERAAAAALEGRRSTGQYAATDAGEPLSKALADPTTGVLLRLTSVLAPAPLPIAAVLAIEGITAAGIKALTALSLAALDPAHGWITIAADAYAAVLAQLADVAHWQTRARAMLLAAFDREMSTAAPSGLVVPLTPHGLHLLQTWPGGGIEREDVLLRAYTARGLMIAGDMVSAEPLLEAWHAEVAQWGAARFGVKATAEFLVGLATLKLQLRGPAEAETVLDEAERGIRSYEVQEGEGPADLVEFILQECTALRGSIRVAQRRFDEAAALLLQALTYFAHHPRGSVRAALTLRELMACWMRWGRVAQALQVLPQVEEALRATPIAAEAGTLCELYLGIAFMQTAGTMQPGKMIQMMNARAHLERALDLAAHALPPVHEDIASCCTNLAIVLRGKDDARAKALLERAVDIRRRLFGPASPQLGTTYLQLGQLLASEGPAEGAEGNLLAALRSLPPAGDSRRREALQGLQKLYGARGDKRRAGEMQRALQAWDLEAAKLPQRAPHPGETAAERNAAFIAATLKRTPPRGGS